jgi:hypothetical protein
MSKYNGGTAITELEQEVLQRLHKAVWRKWCNKWQGQWFLYHNNPSSHTSLVVQHILTEKNIPVISQQLYYPHSE